MSQKLAFVGAFVTCDNNRNLIISNGYIVVDDGKIIKIGTTQEFNDLNKEDYWKYHCVTILTKGQFLMPGFIDCHTHGPQFPNLGLGLDRPLLEWLDKYTFPLEKRYSDEEFASKVYNQVVKRLLKCGTTTACYFGSLHLNGTMQLVHSVVNHGQRALVGKVSMNVENSMGYYNDTAKELADTETFLKNVISLKNPLVQPIITPRFAVSCDRELMTKLGDLAKKYDLMIQTHISENLGEIDCVLQNNAYAKNYADVYDKCQLLTNKSILAHAVHLHEDEIKAITSRGTSIAHCPASNTRLMSGLCPARTLQDAGVTVGLGTGARHVSLYLPGGKQNYKNYDGDDQYSVCNNSIDVAGGDSSSILDAIRRTMDVSAHRQLLKQGSVLSWKEALYMATLGGAKALNLDNKIGSIEVGKELDVLLIDAYKNGGPIDQHDYSVADNQTEFIEQLLQRFIYCGDDRNIVRVFVSGKEVLV